MILNFIIFSTLILCGCSSTRVITKVENDSINQQNILNQKNQTPEISQDEVNSKSCDGHPNGSTTTGYLQPVSSKGTPCIPSSKTCLNGTWVGQPVFPNCSEL